MYISKLSVAIQILSKQVVIYTWSFYSPTLGAHDGARAVLAHPRGGKSLGGYVWRRNELGTRAEMFAGGIDRDYWALKTRYT